MPDDAKGAVASIPVGGFDSYKEAAIHLRRPFAPNAIRFKVQTSNMVVSYVDARTVVERLNHVVPALWSAVYEPWGDRIDTNLLICHLTIDGLTRSDIGKGVGNKDIKEKSAYSDALKRAAVHFGVGVSLYSMSRAYFTIGDGELDSHNKPTLKRKQKKGGGETAELTATGEKWLREQYTKWLDTDRGKHFGAPLDHGDSPDAIGEEVEQATVEAEDETASTELAAKRAEIEKVYSNGTDKRKFPKGKFEARLREADTAEKLDQLKADVEKATSDA